MMQARQDSLHAVKGARLAVKYAVKSVEGLEDMQGNPYVAETGPDGNLTDACVDDLLNTVETGKMITACSQLISGVPLAIIDPSTGKPLEGVSIELPPARKPKARK